MARIARSVRVTGVVQGVFFRGWTKDRADRLGVTGWVRNCPDGSVEAHVEGTAEAVKKLVDAMRCGPEGARVDQIELADVVDVGTTGFVVRH